MHDCDANPGLVTRKFAPFAKSISVAFDIEKEIAYENMAELLLAFKRTQKKRIAHYISEARKLSEYLNDKTGLDNCIELEKEANKILVS